MLRKKWQLFARYVDDNEDEYVELVGEYDNIDALEEARAKDIDDPEFTGYYCSLTNI